MMILGIDPGLAGALAVYDSENNEVVTAVNVPTLSIERNKKIKQALDFHRVMHVMTDITQKIPGLRAVIEQVGAMPGQGVSSMFSFGMVTGALEMAVVAAGVPYSKIMPAVWKKALGCAAGKDLTLLRASQLLPNSVSWWTPLRLERDKEHCIGIAEAALIAYYGAKNLT